MKKVAFVLVIIMLVGMSMTTYAQGEPEADVFATDRPTPVENADPITDANISFTEDVNIHRLSDGETGRGTIDTPDKYWATNGYPDNISFAYEAGGEMLENGTSVAYWEIGIVNADEASKNEILDLLSPNCLITFRDCTYSYKQREAAFNEIYASRDAIVRDVQMLLNSEVVFVEIADGYEKEYARKYVEQYGAFVVVTNDIAAADDAIAAGGLDKGGNNPFDFWFFPICLFLLVGMVTVIFFNRNRFIPVMQTNNGNVITGSTPISRKQTVSAIKNSAITPSNDVFNSIVKRVDDLRK